MKNRTACALLMLVIGTFTSGCKLVKHSGQSAANAGASSFNHGDFDPAAMASALWAPQVLPYISKKAADFGAVQAAIEHDLDAAGKRYGHREKGEDAAWNFVTSIEGVVIEVDTEASPPVVRVDTNHDGKADVEIQIGPIFSGAALRNVLDFISFTKFANQIDFAQFGSALNDRAYAAALKSKIAVDLKGKHIRATGAFTEDSAAEMPSVIPVSFAVEGEK